MLRTQTLFANIGGKSLERWCKYYHLSFKAYCDMTTSNSGQAWTLIARFSNNDTKNWMEDSGEWR